MKSIIVILILLLVVLLFFPSKEKFRNQPLYPEIHNYHKNSYNYGLHGRRKFNHIHFGRFSDYIPFINYLIL